jgi:cellulose synthase/poly-beta-1,6-N-acetylglucosamine synthase-like glycosyltransferase
MTMGISIWFAAGGFIGVAWLLWFAATGQVLRKRKILSSRSYVRSLETAPRVSMLVAAKDEEEHIERCVTGLLAQNYPHFELIVIDDRSEDHTATILRRLADENQDRLRVLTVSELPDGWFGKTHAMHVGSRVSTGDWLLFTDADCRFRSEKTLSSAMSEAFAEESDFLCVTPILETQTAWERVIQPVCALVLMIWFLPSRVNKPKKKTAYANGAFMLIKKSCYEAIGGHERIRSEAGEDIKLAQLTKHAGFRLRVIENEDLYSTRMYDSLERAWHGWGRIFHGSLNSVWRMAISALLLVVFCIAPWVSVLVAVGTWWMTNGNGTPWFQAMIIWLSVVFIMHLVAWRTYRVLRTDGIWSLALVAGSIVALGMMMSAMLKAVGATGTTWRGTTYHSAGEPSRML